MRKTIILQLIIILLLIWAFVAIQEDYRRWTNTHALEHFELCYFVFNQNENEDYRLEHCKRSANESYVPYFFERFKKKK